MVGRRKDPRKPSKKAPIRKNKVRTLETRGKTYKEPAIIGSFWRDHTMDQIQNMTEEETNQTIETFLNKMIARAIKNDRLWDFPILDSYSRIASLPKK
jgi:hypothetical protein